MIKKIKLLAAIFLIQFSFSQTLEFGKISKEELTEKVYSKDSSANAAVLIKDQKTFFNSNSGGVKLVTQMHERIKIYNKEGFDNATVSLRLFKSGTTKERISKIKAYTYNLENDKIIKAELDKDQIFKSELSYNYEQVKFTLPNIKESSVIEFQYRIESPFFFNIDEFRFQYDIPIKQLRAEIRTPKGYNFNAKHKGYINFSPNRTTARDGRLGMSVDILNYKLSHVPALREESFVNNIDNYRAGVMFELVSVIVPGNAPRYYSKNWGDVAQTIGNTDDYEDELDKSRSFDDILDSLISVQNGDIAKMKAIFKYVKENIKWNGIDGKYFQKGIKKALKEKKGNAADINLTLVAMLRYAGIDANPVIISTKDNLIPVFPTIDRLNYVLAYAVIDNKQYFLDATEEFSDINILPLKDYNWKGVLVDNNKMVWKRVPINEPKLGMSQYMITADLTDSGEISGDLKSRYTNHSAFKFRENYKDQDLDTYITKKEELLENIEISNYEVKNTSSFEGFVSESFEFYKETGADIIDDKIYIQPLLLFKIKENPFKSETRKFPIDFGYPLKDSYMVNINLPEGYAVESCPDPIVAQIPNNLGEFRFIPKLLDNKIQLVVSLEIKNAIIGAENYLFLKEFFNQIVSKEAEQIVLSKV